MAESQNIEYKTSWDDDYLRWVCGFANAQGGRIYIGCDDDGNVVGVKGIKGLMESIPNKIKDTLGIMADVNKRTKNKKDYIEIIVRPSSYPVSYNGEYHYRSGATKQQLRGAALTEFLVKKTGAHWEDIPVDNIGVKDLDEYSFEIFRREALRKRRMSEDDLRMSNEELLDHLDLLQDGKLKRAAVLLFYNKPEKLVTGSFVKIGRFGEGSDIQYHDDVDGSIMRIADRALDMIYEKYLKVAISYEHDRRVEIYPFARDAVREAVFNALVHNCYQDGVPIQIRIDETSMSISNCCRFPSDWTVKTLMEPHKSRPYNPTMARVFYRAGFIETWGRGIQKICEVCKEHGSPKPKYTILGNDLTVIFKAHKDTIKANRSELKRQNNSDSGALNDALGDALTQQIIEALRKKDTISQSELAEQLQTSRRTIQRKMDALKQQGYISREGGKRTGRWIINTVPQ